MWVQLAFYAVVECSRQHTGRWTQTVRAGDEQACELGELTDRVFSGCTQVVDQLHDFGELVLA